MVGLPNSHEGYFDHGLQYKQHSDEEKYRGWYGLRRLAGGFHSSQRAGSDHGHRKRLVIAAVQLKTDDRINKINISLMLFHCKAKLSYREQLLLNAG